MNNHYKFIFLLLFSFTLSPMTAPSTSKGKQKENSVSENKSDLLIKAIRDEDLEKVKQLAQETNYFSHSTDDGFISNTSPLFIAIKKGNLSIVRFLIENDPSNIAALPVITKKGIMTTLLHIATYFEHFEIVKYLVEHGMYVVKTKNCFLETPLDISQLKKNKAIEHYLLSKGAKKIIVKPLLPSDIIYQHFLNKVDPTAIYFAAVDGDLKKVEYLIKYSRTSNFRNSAGTLLFQSPMVQAVKNGHFHVVKFLVEECKEKPGIAFINHNNIGRTAALAQIARNNDHNEIALYLEKKYNESNRQSYLKDIPLELYRLICSFSLFNGDSFDIDSETFIQFLHLKQKHQQVLAYHIINKIINQIRSRVNHKTKPKYLKKLTQLPPFIRNKIYFHFLVSYPKLVQMKKDKPVDLIPNASITWDDAYIYASKFKIQIVKSPQDQPSILEKGISCLGKLKIPGLQNKFIVSGSNTGIIKIWDIDTRKCVKAFKPHNHAIVKITQINENTLQTLAKSGTTKDWRFEPLDLVLDSIMVHNKQKPFIFL